MSAWPADAKKISLDAAAAAAATAAAALLEAFFRVLVQKQFFNFPFRYLLSFIFGIYFVPECLHSVIRRPLLSPRLRQVMA